MTSLYRHDSVSPFRQLFRFLSQRSESLDQVFSGLLRIDDDVEELLGKSRSRKCVEDKKGLET